MPPGQIGQLKGIEPCWDITVEIDEPGYLKLTQTATTQKISLEITLLEGNSGVCAGCDIYINPPYGDLTIAGVSHEVTFPRNTINRMMKPGSKLTVDASPKQVS